MTIARLVVSFLFAVAAAPVNAAVFTVGADGACTHGNLLSAISAAASNGAASDDIRVARNRTYTSITLPIVSHSVYVRGGYDTCADTTPSGHTVIAGTAAGSNGTISTSGTAASLFVVRLQGLVLRDGGNLTSRRGGALRIEGSFDVRLDDVLVVDNRGGRGGGIYIDGSNEAKLTVRNGTEIDSNVAGISGGGIYCTAGGLISLVDALILDNIAQDGISDVNESGNGGGVALYDDCRMLHDGGSVFDAGLRNNVAARHGGGYYLRNADVHLYGTPSAAARVSNNEAADVGGGIAVNDDITGGDPGAVTSHVRLEDSRIDSNRAPRGGGIGLLVGGMVNMQRILPGNICHDATRCSTLSNNATTAAAAFCHGAAVYAGLHSSFTLYQTLVEDNCRNTHGYAIDLAEDAVMFIERIVLARSGDRPFNFDDSFDGTLVVAWSTIISEAGPTRAAFMFLPPAATGVVRVFGSILGEAFEHLVVADGGGVSAMSTTFDCVLVDTAFIDPTAPVRALEAAAPYGMLSPSTGNYRLASSTTSVPVDFCDNSLEGRNTADADGNFDLLDSPRANLFGIIDIGAYELMGDVIFANGFE